MQNFVRFHAVEYKIELQQEFWNQSPLVSYIYPSCIITISNDIHFVHKFLCNFIHERPKSAYSKNSRKRVTTAPPVERFKN